MTTGKRTGEDLRGAIIGKHMVHGACWNLASCLLIQLLVGYYLFRWRETLSDAQVAWGFCQFAGLGVGGLGALLAARFPAIRGLWYVSAGGLGLCWSLTALNIVHNWDVLGSATKVITLGLFSLMIGWYMHLPVLFTAIAPILVTLVTLYLRHGTHPPLDLAISLVKYPFLILLCLLTLRRWFALGLEKYVENIRLNGELMRLSRTDELTQVKNRKGFNEAFGTAIHMARRLEQPLSLVLLDIDFFKKYNDALGHPAGDACLARVAQVVSEQVRRATDTFARVGGEEFALVLPGSNAAQAAALVERIQGALAECGLPHPASAVSDRVTLSIGIAVLSGDDEAGLYGKADRALYAAKAAGRDRYEVAR